MYIPYLPACLPEYFYFGYLHTGVRSIPWTLFFSHPLCLKIIGSNSTNTTDLRERNAPILRYISCTRCYSAATLRLLIDFLQEDNYSNIRIVFTEATMQNRFIQIYGLLLIL